MRQMLRPLLATALLAVAAPVFAADQAAKANFGPQQITWEPQIAHESTVLTVSTPSGKVERHEFKGTPPTFELSTTAADGTYHWELQILPAAQPRHRRSQQGGEEPMAARQQGAIVSGTFVVTGGQIVSPDAREPRVAAQKSTPVVGLDQVIPDDLIVQGSACIGLDCVNNESFGFDTIRMKENNTRIKFEDTSVGTFPTNDWQLTANDSASGGASKFSIEDITGSRVPFTVTAGAATNSLFIDSTGRLGLRTSTPVLDLHINTSNTPAVRLEQNNSGGFTAQTWDIAGNEANFFVRDVTGGSRLPFRIRPGAPTSSIDISSDGDVGVGTGSPSEKFHVFESVDANTLLLVENTNTGLSATAVLRAKADVAQLNFQAHASTRTISRFGKTLGSWTEMLTVTGNGLAIGTLTAVPLVLGTNATNRMEIGGTGGVTVTGNFTVTGGTKNFAVPDPADATKAIYFAALEGPEAGTYVRGTAKTVDGEAVIDLPGYFTRMTEAERMTVQLTPVGGWGQIYVAEKSPGRLVVRTAPGSADMGFDYLVQGVRKGYLDYQVERENTLPR